LVCGLSAWETAKLATDAAKLGVAPVQASEDVEKLLH
jgi:hypothetical protein